MADSKINENAPSLEPNSALRAQLESTKRTDSPRIATLYTKNAPIVSLTARERAILYDVVIVKTSETLRLNKEKAKRFFKSKNPPTTNVVINYLENNGYAALIAKAENVGTDTGGDSFFVVARDQNGIELTASKVTCEETYRLQIEINKKEFGDNVLQRLETGGEVGLYRYVAREMRGESVLEAERKEFLEMGGALPIHSIDI